MARSPPSKSRSYRSEFPQTRAARLLTFQEKHELWQHSRERVLLGVHKKSVGRLLFFTCSAYLYAFKLQVSTLQAVSIECASQYPQPNANDSGSEDDLGGIGCGNVTYVELSSGFASIASSFSVGALATVAVGSVFGGLLCDIFPPRVITLGLALMVRPQPQLLCGW
jgi:hypothetical protein